MHFFHNIDVVFFMHFFSQIWRGFFYAFFSQIWRCFLMHFFTNLSWFFYKFCPQSDQNWKNWYGLSKRLNPNKLLRLILRMITKFYNLKSFFFNQKIVIAIQICFSLIRFLKLIKLNFCVQQKLHRIKWIKSIKNYKKSIISIKIIKILYF